MTALPWRQVGDVWTCEEVRPGVVLSHRWSVGDGIGTLHTTATWAGSDRKSELVAPVVIGDRDPLEVADGLARGWGL